jgi:4-hydroxyphenylpyruvate dioxygenase
MGFEAVARHRGKAITLYQQGDVHYLVNEEPGSHAARFAAEHGPCASSMAFRVVDAKHAYRRALELGAEPADPAQGSLALDVPAIKGIGGSLLYFLDRYGAKGSAFDAEFVWTGAPDPRPYGQGLFYLDHLTHNVGRGRMDFWANFYERLFNFKEIRFFDIKGKYTGLFSRALTSPDGKIRIPINESADEQSQIESTCTSTRARASSTSLAVAATSTRRSRPCANAGSSSCLRLRPPTTSASTSASPTMARTWPGCTATASCSTAKGRWPSARRKAG